MSLLHDQVVIITGAAGGIGRAVAKLCADHGAKLSLIDSGVEVDGTAADTARLDVVADEFRQQGGRVIALGESVSSGPAAQRSVEATLSEFGKVDALINCAGISRDRSLLAMTDEQFD